MNPPNSQVVMASLSSAPSKTAFVASTTKAKKGFFTSRRDKCHSTVFRANMPPGPFISSNPRVIVLLDGKSFPVLFDVTKVEKKDLFTCTNMPSTKLTGGYRILSYLDPSEPDHTKVKQLLFYLLKTRSDKVIPSFSATCIKLFDLLEKEGQLKGEVGFNYQNDRAAFRFLARSWFDQNLEDAELAPLINGCSSVSIL